MFVQPVPNVLHWRVTGTSANAASAALAAEPGHATRDSRSRPTCAEQTCPPPTNRGQVVLPAVERLHTGSEGDSQCHDIVSRVEIAVSPNAQIDSSGWRGWMRRTLILWMAKPLVTWHNQQK